MENKPPYTTVIQEAVLYCRELLENYFNESFQYHYYHDFKSSDKENILIVDFPLSVWEDAITDTFVKYFRGVKILPEVKKYFDSWLLRIELSSGTARFNTDGLIVAGVKFENGVIAKKLAECITLALQPQMTTFGQPTHSTGECITPQPQQLLQPDQTTTDAGKPQQYTVDTGKITAVYDFCIETNVISDSISEVDFINAVSKADFKPIYETAKLKHKCKYIIYVLSFLINNPMRSQWYKDTAHSINTEPNKCSGANVPGDWKKDANKSIK
ncbi:MAG: hypothetical protein MdMp024_1565 [Bacteroidales bacterium]